MNDWLMGGEGVEERALVSILTILMFFLTFSICQEKLLGEEFRFC